MTPVRGSTSAPRTSTAGTVELLRRGQGRGIAISAGDPHRLLLTDQAPQHLRQRINRINPAAARESDVQALRAALAEGVIDCVGTDHAPHAMQDKCWQVRRGATWDASLGRPAIIVDDGGPRTAGLAQRRARVMSEAPRQDRQPTDQGRPIAVRGASQPGSGRPRPVVGGRRDRVGPASQNTPYAGMTIPATSDRGDACADAPPNSTARCAGEPADLVFNIVFIALV